MSAPNIVLMMTDQQRWDALGCLGQQHMVTPNIDALAARGACLSHAFVQAATCAPSRASIVTAKYAHAHGAMTNMTWPGDREPNFVEQLRVGGYHTANIGKMHTAPLRQAFGFEHRLIVENKNHLPGESGPPDDYDLYLERLGLRRPAPHYHETVENWFEQLGTTIWPLADDLFPDSFVGREAVEYVAAYDFERPLFLWAGFAGPHDPYDVPASVLARYPGENIPEPVGYAGEAADKPARHRESMEKMGRSRHPAAIWWQHATPEKVRRLRRHYFANIMLIDEWVGRIVQAVEAAGQLDNTLFVFTSDHGDALGDHGQIYKFSTHYDSVVRVPLVMAGPGVACQGVIDPMVEMIDLGPTLLEFAGVSAMDERQVHGRSFASVVRGEATSFRDVVFSEEGRQRCMVRTRDWKLVYYPGRTDGELYHVAMDPDELTNLYHNPEHAEVRWALCERLIDWHVRTRCQPEVHEEGLLLEQAKNR